MEASIIFCVLVVLSLNTTLSFAQPPESFFPHHVGDTWQYTLDNTNIIYDTDIIVADSTDSVGTVYLKYEGETWYHYYIDTSYNVYGSRGGPSYSHYYKLDADSGDSWWFRDQEIRATVVDIYADTFWGVSATVKEIEYWLIIPGDSLWLATRFLASDFGLVAFWGEPGPFYHLSGAIIDSVLYGFIVGLDERQIPPIVPEVVELYQNYPNPFNASTTIEYRLNCTTMIILDVYSSLGQHVANLVNEIQIPGNHQIHFDGSNISSGMYYYRIEAGSFSWQNKMLLVK